MDVDEYVKKYIPKLANINHVTAKLITDEIIFDAVDDLSKQMISSSDLNYEVFHSIAEKENIIYNTIACKLNEITGVDDFIKPDLFIRFIESSFSYSHSEGYVSNFNHNEGEVDKEMMDELYKLTRKKVFLGGTCNNTVWREKLIPLLTIDYFNPVVEDWTEECAKEENRQKEICDYCLYVITPAMKGVYSIAEVVDDSNKRPEKAILCVLEREVSIERDGKSYYPNGELYFDNSQLKSLNQVSEMVKRNGGTCFTNLDDVANYLNNL